MATLTAEDYKLKQGESPSAYNERIAQTRGDTPESLTNIQSLTTQAISSANLAQIPSITPVTSTTPITPVVPTPTETPTDPNAITLTPQESTAQAENERLRALVTSSLGESALKAEKEVAEGIS